MKKEHRTPVPVTIAFVLLCLVLISAHFASGMLARYVVEATRQDTTIVASFDVDAVADETTPVSIVADGTDENGKAQYTVTVKNTGETAVHYEAQVVFTGDDAQENAALFDNSDDQLTFDGDLVPGEQADETITLDLSGAFDANDKYSTFSNDDISGSNGTAPFKVIVTFTQLD